MKKFLTGFSFAFAGIWYAFRTQVNMKFHFIATLLVLGACFAFNISFLEWFFVGFSITLVWAAELFNTAIESVTDLATKEIHPLAKASKDTAAGAVLICSIFSFIVGLSVFTKYIIALFD